MPRNYKQCFYLAGSVILGFALPAAGVEITSGYWWVIASVYHINSYILTRDEV